MKDSVTFAMIADLADDFGNGSAAGAVHDRTPIEIEEGEEA